MQLDPMVSLAHAIQSRPKRYALLLGSGVSRSAGIPTGWEILGQLIGRIRRLDDVGGDEDDATWFAKRFGEPADYSRVVERLGRTECERQELLRGFFEPDSADQGAGTKRPSAAHKAIARLVKGGFIQVIITTNFDRLVETALAEEGIQPTVISTEHQVEGMVPLVHQKVIVFKVHGDYRDPSIRNTAGELSEYGPAITRLLNQICESYGLVVCGWSGEWDPALRNALEAATARRFSMHWASRSEPTERAQSLIRAREAEVVLGLDADRFFDDLAGKVFALQDAATAHPRSLELLAAESRRLVRVAEDVPQLERFLQETVERARSSLIDVVRVESPGTLPKIADWIPRAQDILADVYAACIPAARWATGRQVRTLQGVVQRLHEAPRVPAGGGLPNESYWVLPSFLAFHTIGAAMAAGRNWPALFELVGCTPIKTRDGFTPYVRGVDWIDAQGRFAEGFGEGKGRLVASRWLFDRWNEVGVTEVPSDQERDEAFLRFELAVALAYRALTAPSTAADERRGVYVRDDTPPWLPPGLYNWRASFRGGERRFVDELRADRQFDSALQDFASALSKPVAVQSLYECLQAWLTRTDKSFW